MALCPTWAAANHPLITEDTGVLGRGVWQLELHGERSHDREGGATTRGIDASAVLSYGAMDQVDLQLELPYVREKTNGIVVADGRGDASLSLKWRFFERAGRSLVVKPDIHEGRRWGLNLVGGYAIGRLQLLAHVGHMDNRNVAGERSSLKHASVAGIFSAAEKLKLVLDLGRDTNPAPGAGGSLREGVLGLMHAVSEDMDFGVGIKWGLSDPADDRALLAGVKLRF